MTCSLCWLVLPDREVTSRQQRLRELRRMLVHEYATATAEEVHESARIASDAFPLFYNAYLQWIQHGFKPRAPPSSDMAA